ncbi:RDD family protein [Vibrio sp. FNV 38]|nr:RDD family protein [Vibrio sp. FNV 38]
MNSIKDYPTAGMIRRFAALFYDALIILAIEMLAAGVVVAILEAGLAMGIVNYGQYADVGDFLSKHPIWSPLYTFYLAVIWIGFFAYFWTRAGQTLGMRAWKLKLISEEGPKVTLTQALIRIATSGFGLANLAVPVDPKKRAFHDIWAKTRVIVLPKAN